MNITSTDYITRLNQINDYVGEQIAALDTSGSDPDTITTYLLEQLRTEENYEEDPNDERLIFVAVKRQKEECI